MTLQNTGEINKDSFGLSCFLGETKNKVCGIVLTEQDKNDQSAGGNDSIESVDISNIHITDLHTTCL